MSKSRNAVMFLDLENLSKIDLSKINLNSAVDFSIVLDHMIKSYKENNKNDIAESLEKYHGMISEDLCEIVTHGMRQIFQETNLVFKNSHMMLDDMRAKGMLDNNQ